MTDIFDNKILCKRCGREMKKSKIIKNGFLLRVLVCDKCGEKIVHPTDEAEYHRFLNLRNKKFNVKMRLVGNSYTVSIPREIVLFMQEQEKMFKDFDNMVKLCFEQMGKLSLNFRGEENRNE